MRKEVGFDIVFGSQKIFRILLDAFARPGRIKQGCELNIAPPWGGGKFAFGVLFSLLDLEAGFSVCCFDERVKREVEEYVVLNTGSNLLPSNIADFILALDSSLNIKKVKRGTLEYPDHGSTVIRVVEELGENLEGSSLDLVLTGPGIKDKARVSVKGIEAREVEKMIEVNRKFPLGIDFLFVDGRDRVVAIPRSVRIESLEGR